MRTHNANVIHRWANGLAGRNGATARSGNGNISTDGTRLWSYSTVIACHMPEMNRAPDGRRVALITTRVYSVTTSGKHMPRERDIPASVRAFRVPNVSAPLSAVCHESNLDSFKDRADKAARCIARDTPGASYAAADIRAAARDAADYAHAFALRVPSWAEDAESIIAQAEADKAARIARNSTPAAVRRRAREAERRERTREAREDMATRIARAWHKARTLEKVARWASAPAWRGTAADMLKRATGESSVRAVAPVAARELRDAFRTERERRETLAREMAAAAERDARLLGERDAESALAWWRECQHPLAHMLATLRPPALGLDYRVTTHGRGNMLPGYVVSLHMMRDDAFAERVRTEAAAIVARDEAEARERRERDAAAARERAERAAREAAEMRAAFPNAEAARNAFRERGDTRGFRLHPSANVAADGRDILFADVARGMVRTGRGADVPLADAVRAFRFIASRIRAGALPWHRGSGLAGATAGGFALESIAADGAATFGCHTFGRREMERAARAAGVDDATADTLAGADMGA